MKISTGVMKDGRHFDLDLEDQDGMLQVGVDNYTAMSLAERYRLLSRIGDLFVVDYMVKDNMISEEMARDRRTEINKR